MILSYLSAENFRNICECRVDFSPGVNVLLGENAQGKTNALECIYLFARGRSFRTASDGDLVRFGERGFSAEIGFRDRHRDQTLTWRMYDGRRKRLKNGAEIERVSEMLGSFRAVLFCPDHLQLVKGGPEGRREFLNIAISQLNGEYIRRYAMYKKILDNRNALLKAAQKNQYFDREELLAWTEQMSSHAAYLTRVRRAYVGELEVRARELLLSFSEGRETLVTAYESEIPGETEEEIADGYRRTFAAGEKREMLAGCSLWGVHRDDLKLTVNGTDARNFASQGQQRSVVLALKMAEGGVCRDHFGEEPVYLFDDVLSELDAGRRSYVLSGARDKQIIVTSCEKDLFSTDHLIFVRGGSYVSSRG